MGSTEREATVARMRSILDQLDSADVEHNSVSLTHESEWCLSAFHTGLLVWENLEHGQPRHMHHVSRVHVLDLWEKLAAGKIDELHTEPWLPGYG
jgi:hypothetical protein